MYYKNAETYLLLSCLPYSLGKAKAGAAQEIESTELLLPVPWRRSRSLGFRASGERFRGLGFKLRELGYKEV